MKRVDGGADELKINGEGLPQEGLNTQADDKQPCHAAPRTFRAGDACPRCTSGRLDYDGMLNLVCPQCGYQVNTGGAFT